MTAAITYGPPVCSADNAFSRAWRLSSQAVDFFTNLFWYWQFQPMWSSEPLYLDPVFPQRIADLARG